MPIVAATAAIAVSITAVVTLSRTGSSDPAGPPGVIQVPVDDSPELPLDLGVAELADAQAAARRCLTPKKNGYGYPNHLEQPGAADVAEYRTGRWLGINDATGRGISKHLLQTFTTRDSNRWYQCLDGEMLRDGNAVTVMTSATDPIPGVWSWSTTGSVARASYSFRAYKTVDVVQLRIRGTSQASGWYSVRAEDTSGYVEGTLENAVTEHGKAEVDVRALDKDGKQLWFTTFG